MIPQLRPSDPTFVPPDFSDKTKWVRARDAADYFRRAPRTIVYWCQTGLISKYGMSSYQDLNGLWWIRLHK